MGREEETEGKEDDTDNEETLVEQMENYAQNLVFFASMVFAVIVSNCHKDDWVSVWADWFDLVEEGEGEDLSNDDVSKLDYNDCNDDGDGHKASCDVLMIDFDSQIFPYSIGWE